MIQNWKLNTSIIFLSICSGAILYDFYITLMSGVTLLDKTGYALISTIYAYFTIVIPFNLIFEHKKQSSEEQQNGKNNN
jgi:hypothetical protein